MNDESGFFIAGAIVFSVLVVASTVGVFGLVALVLADIFDGGE